MWIFTSDGPWLGGKRVWLRPGERHLFGRTTSRASEGQQNHHIDEKSVSRQHLIVEVSPVEEGASAHLHTRTEIKFIDNSKTGTTLNGDHFIKSTRIVGQAGTDFVVKLGKAGPHFKLQWQTVCLTLANLPKATKQREDLVQGYRDRLEPADIKIVTEYVTNYTTHVVAKKRNNPAVLQALTQAKFVVTDSFVNALIEASRKRGTDPNGDLIPSLLESDLDLNWPNADDYVPQAGEEPVPRPQSYLKPDPNRKEVFKDYVFIFTSRQQIDNLMGVITTGGGKAFCWEYEATSSKAEELVDFARSVCGRKMHDIYRISQHPGPGGVVFVRRADDSKAYADFELEAQLACGQRSIMQNELLDIILTLDTSGLRRPLAEGGGKSGGHVDSVGAVEHSTRVKTPPQKLPQPTSSGRALIHNPNSPTEATIERRRSRQSIHSDESQPQSQQDRDSTKTELQQQQHDMPRKRVRRFITESRFKGFDDFDPSQFTKPEPESPGTVEKNEQITRKSSGLPEESDMDGDDGAEHLTQPQRKRKTADEEQREEDEARLRQMLAGPAGYKRQKTEAAEASARNSSRVSPSRGSKVQTSEPKDQSKLQKGRDADMKAEMQKRREQEDELRRKEEENIRQAMADANISDLKNLVKVETMELPVRNPVARRSANGNTVSDRWDPAWNGRKNFKKFQPQGQRRDRPRLQRVIVTLEEVPRRGHGLGNEYWLDSSSNDVSRNSESQAQADRPDKSWSTQQQQQDEEISIDDDVATFRRRIQISREEDAYEHDETGLIEEQVHGTDSTGGQPSPSKTLLASSDQTRASTKRPAREQGGLASKKIRQTRLPLTRPAPALEDDDDDGLKFRRRKR